MGIIRSAKREMKKRQKASFLFRGTAEFRAKVRRARTSKQSRNDMTIVVGGQKPTA
jgi:hypothetical protein